MPGHVNMEFGGLSVLAKTERCPRCGRHIGRERATFAAADKPVSRFSLFATSDGFYVANKKFRDFAIAHGFTRVEFVPLENGYFVLKVARLVAYDLSTAWVDQEDWCRECKTFRRNLTVPGSHPIAAHEAPIGPFEVVESYDRWGVEVGLHTAQIPNLIVGDAAWQAIEAARFKGVTIVEVGKMRRY